MTQPLADLRDALDRAVDPVRGALEAWSGLRASYGWAWGTAVAVAGSAWVTAAYVQMRWIDARKARGEK